MSKFCNYCDVKEDKTYGVYHGFARHFDKNGGGTVNGSVISRAGGEVKWNSYTCKLDGFLDMQKIMDKTWEITATEKIGLIYIEPDINKCKKISVEMIIKQPDDFFIFVTFIARYVLNPLFFDEKVMGVRIRHLPLGYVVEEEPMPPSGHVAGKKTIPPPVPVVEKKLKLELECPSGANAQIDLPVTQNFIASPKVAVGYCANAAAKPVDGPPKSPTNPLHAALAGIKNANNPDDSDDSWDYRRSHKIKGGAGDIKYFIMGSMIIPIGEIDDINTKIKKVKDAKGNEGALNRLNVDEGYDINMLKCYYSNERNYKKYDTVLTTNYAYEILKKNKKVVNDYMNAINNCGNYITGDEIDVRSYSLVFNVGPIKP